MRDGKVMVVLAPDSTSVNVQADTGRRRPTWRAALIVVALILAVAAVAVNTSAVATPGADKRLVVLPLAVVVAVGLVLLALDRFEVFVLVLLATRTCLDAAKLSDKGLGAVLNPASLAALLLAGSGVAWLYARRRAGARHPGSTLQTCVLLYLAAEVVSAIASNYLSVSALALLRAATGIAMFFVLDRLIHDERSLVKVLWAVLASAALPLLVVVLGALSGHQLTETKEGVRRVTATFAQSNPFAHYLVAVSLLSLAVLPYVAKRFRVPLALVVLVMVGSLGLTYTRGAWVGFVVGLLVLVWLYNRALILAVVAAGVVVVLAVPSVSARIHDLSSDPNTPRHVNSLEWRFRYWGEVLPLAAQNPLTGVGLGSSSQELDSGKAPHNDYLRSLVELGIVGLLAYVALLVTFVRTAWRAYRVAPPGIQRGIALGTLAFSVALGLVSIADNINDQVVLLWYVFAFMAMANWIARTGSAAAAVPALEPPAQDAPPVPPTRTLDRQKWTSS